MNKNKQAKSTAKSAAKLKQLSRVDTLIITVGTRQIGWCCSDKIVRCFGTDGEKGDPPHVKELYQVLGKEVGFHQEGDVDSRWNVRDLGEQYWKLCNQSSPPDFSAVELLMDEKIIEGCVRAGLKHVILWGTDQPENIPWRYRRQDTLWLAELMAGKIRQKWPKLDVSPLHTSLNVGMKDEIRQELEDNILPFALKPLVKGEVGNEFVLAIENTGCAPNVAEGLSICVAALARQCQVVNVVPKLPVPAYLDPVNGARNAQKSSEYEAIAVGEYFWPLERSRVISAWQRGDFKEAEIWLSAHQSRYKGVLYKLAGQLALLVNGDFRTFLDAGNKGIENWLRSPALKELADPQKIQGWLELCVSLRTREPAKVFESTLSIYLALRRGDYSNAFRLFAQTLERLLYLQYKTQNWLGKGFVTIPPTSTYLGANYQPGLKQLIDGWFDATGREKEGQPYKLFETIRYTRNAIVHDGDATNLAEIISVWSANNLPIPVTQLQYEGLMEQMVKTLQMVAPRDWDIPNPTLGRSLYDWGLDLLR